MADQAALLMAIAIVVLIIIISMGNNCGGHRWNKSAAATMTVASQPTAPITVSDGTGSGAPAVGAPVVVPATAVTTSGTVLSSTGAPVGTVSTGASSGAGASFTQSPAPPATTANTSGSEYFGNKPQWKTIERMSIPSGMRKYKTKAQIEHMDMPSKMRKYKNKSQFERFVDGSGLEQSYQYYNVGCPAQALGYPDDPLSSPVNDTEHLVTKPFVQYGGPMFAQKDPRRAEYLTVKVPSIHIVTGKAQPKVVVNGPMKNPVTDANLGQYFGHEGMVPGVVCRTKDGKLQCHAEHFQLAPSSSVGGIRGAWNSGLNVMKQAVSKVTGNEEEL